MKLLNKVGLGHMTSLPQGELTVSVTHLPQQIHTYKTNIEEVLTMGVRWTNNRETILFDEDPHRLPYLKKLVSKPD
jgi:hypothetical protein